MPMDRSLYPSDWEYIALAKKDRSNWCCEECGKPCRMPFEKKWALVERLKSLDSARWINELFGLSGEAWHLDSQYHEEDMRPQRFTLTVSHTNHDPWNPDAELRALCAPCHCRYDISPEQMERKRKAKLEYYGQQNLLDYLNE